MSNSNLIDSSVWIDYLIKGNHKERIETDEMLLLSVLSIFEIKRKLLREGVSISKVEECINFVKERSFVIEISPLIAESAVKISLDNNLPAMDALIYSCSINNGAILISMDNHFANLKNAIVLR